MFNLVRDVDVSGVSGTGKPAQGIQFDDGTCAMRWLTGTNSTGFYNSIEDLIFIHGHNGATRVEWIGWTPVEQINSLDTAHKYKGEVSTYDPAIQKVVSKDAVVLTDEDYERIIFPIDRRASMSGHYSVAVTHKTLMKLMDYRKGK